ncbi:MAG: hypothetical protein MR704_14800 [Clostridia bacterium]|nr:hypothetical protein [Clostridia bacterium]
MRNKKGITAQLYALPLFFIRGIGFWDCGKESKKFQVFTLFSTVAPSRYQPEAANPIISPDPAPQTHNFA